MTLWVVFAAMSLVALAFAAWPLYRRERKLTPLLAVTIVGIVVLSSGLYYQQGQPDVTSGTATSPEMDEVIESLAARLEENPDDVNGWTMLGRSYLALGDYQGAIDAFEQVNDIEGGQNPQTLVSLGEARLGASQGAIVGEISALFESALAMDPNNPQALFYGGIGAFNRNELPLAADRWERLLSLNPPAEIQGILRQRIAEWRGEPAPEIEAPPPAPAPQPAPVEEAPAGTVVSVDLLVSDTAISAIGRNAVVFIIARDPAAPVPPIAVARRQLAELPAVVHLGDRESMVPGRELSGFAEFEIVARVSLSGQPGQQSGDWFGSVIVKPAESATVNLVISEQVP